MEPFEGVRFHGFIRPNRELLVLRGGEPVDPVGQVAGDPGLAGFIRPAIGPAGHQGAAGGDRNVLIELCPFRRDGEDGVGEQTIIGPRLLQVGGKFRARRRDLDVVAHRPASRGALVEPADGNRETVVQMQVAVGAAIEFLQARMGKGHVVALVVDVAHRFPVHRQFDRPFGVLDRQQLVDAVGREIRTIGRQQFGDRGLSARPETQEDEAVEDLHLDRLQAEVLTLHLAEARGSRRAAQAAVEIVDPAVERTDDRAAAMALLAIDHAGAAMTAEIVKGAHHAVVAAHHHGAFAEQVEGQPVSGRGHVAHMSHHLPVGEEKLLTFEFEQRWRMIGPGRKAAAVPVVRHGDRLVRDFSHAGVSILSSTQW